MLARFVARRAAVVLGGCLGALSLGVACSPGKGAGGAVTDSGNGGGSAAGGTSSLGGGGTTIIGGTSGASGATGGIGATGTGGSGPECAGDLVMGMPVPVDVYIMLDISGSMLTDTGAASVTKWSAVKGALNSFLTDNASAGLNVAIQYFPLQSPGTPTSCTASADCGDRGPCLMKACAVYAAGFVQCETDTDCDNALVKDDGPCENGFCHLSGAACADAAACQVHATNVGPCVGLGHCQANMANTCLEPGTLCSANNPCVAVPSSVCVHETLCDQTSYATPAVEFGALPGSAAAITASINAQMPRGETPSRPALRGAIDHARAWATSHPGHSVVVVLATDGLPTDCGNGNAIHPSSAAEVDEVVAVATEGISMSPNISTFVVGVFAASDASAPANLNRIAVAGGSNQAFMVDASGTSVDAQFLTALNTIRASRLGCEFQIPTPPPGQTLDYSYVNVVLNDSAGNPTQIPRVLGGVDRCAEVGGGWYYDPEPGPMSVPTRIVACPMTCGTIQSTLNGSVQVKLGCRTIER